MTNSRSCIKTLKSTYEIVFNVSGYRLVEILQLVHEISSFPEVLYKRIVLKNFSKFTDKHTQNSHQGMFCQNMFSKNLQNSQENIFSGVFFLITLQTGNLKLSETATGDVL